MAVSALGLRARPGVIAVAGAFLLHGAAAGSFAGRIPALQDHLGLSAGELGLALLMVALGCITTMQAGALVAQRVGHRAVLLGCLVAWAVLLPLAAAAPSLALLCVVLYLVGVASGNADVAMNALGVHVERRRGGSVMSRLHGLWSVGGFIGAVVAAVFAHSGASVGGQFVFMGLAGVVGAAACWPGWADPYSAGTDAPPGFVRPSRRVLVIGAIAFGAVFAEIGSADWSAVFLRDVTGAGPGAAALGVVAVSAAMAIGRFGGDAAVQRFGPARTVRTGAVLAVVGVLVLLAGHWTWSGVLGFGLIGLGVSTVVPLAFAAAGRIGGDHPGQQIAAVATLGYGAGMVTPSLVGLVTQLSSIQVAFAVVGLLLLAIVALAPRLRT